MPPLRLMQSTNFFITPASSDVATDHDGESSAESTMNRCLLLKSLRNRGGTRECNRKGRGWPVDANSPALEARPGRQSGFSPCHQSRNSTKIAAPQRATNQASESQTRTSSWFMNRLARRANREVSVLLLLPFIACSCLLFVAAGGEQPPDHHPASASTAL